MVAVKGGFASPGFALYRAHRTLPSDPTHSDYKRLEAEPAIGQVIPDRMHRIQAIIEKIGADP